MATTAPRAVLLPLLPLLLLVVLAPTAGWGSPAPALPHWTGPLPDPSQPRAGLPWLNGTTTNTVFNASLRTANGTYNHGPSLTYWGGLFYMTFYNAPRDEGTAQRVVQMTSGDAVSWGRLVEVFPNVTQRGMENEPYFRAGPRLYAAASDVALSGGHDTGVLGAVLMREVLGPASMGPIFWVARAAPPHATAFPTYLEMPAQTRADAEAYLEALVNETVPAAHPANGSPFSERSLYRLPEQPRDLVLLLRVDQRLWASRCNLPGGHSEEVHVVASNATGWGECRAGTGGLMFAEPSVSIARPMAGSPHRGAARVQQCAWAVPRETNIPDAPSRTCAGVLPPEVGGAWLLGNQGGESRDPLVLSWLPDGLAITKAWAVRANAPPVRFPGHAKGPGFQYPSGLWCRACGPVRNRLLMVYSVGKEDIQISAAPLTSIRA